MFAPDQPVPRAVRLAPAPAGTAPTPRGQGVNADTGCLRCHERLEAMHPKAELSCTDCHGGDGQAKIREEAHVPRPRSRGEDESVARLDEDLAWRRFKNPMDLRVVDRTCAPCHDLDVHDLLTSLHGTTAGHLSDGYYEMGHFKQKGSRFSVFEPPDPTVKGGAVTSLKQVEVDPTPRHHQSRLRAVRIPHILPADPPLATVYENARLDPLLDTGRIAFIPRVANRQHQRRPDRKLEIAGVAVGDRAALRHPHEAPQRRVVGEVWRGQRVGYDPWGGGLAMAVEEEVVLTEQPGQIARERNMDRRPGTLPSWEGSGGERQDDDGAPSRETSH